MKITYNQNPLVSTIELDEREYEILRLKIQIDMLEEKIVDANMYLGEHRFDIEAAKQAVDLKFLDEGSNFKAEIERTFAYLKDELTGEHAGDCICLPCSCCKCMAEERLGIDTLGGAGKHTLNKVSHVFSQPGVSTCDDAITWLESHEVEIPEAKMLPYFEGWKQTRLKAIAYLKNYSLTHLKG